MWLSDATNSQASILNTLTCHSLIIIRPMRSENQRQHESSEIWNGNRQRWAVPLQLQNQPFTRLATPVLSTEVWRLSILVEDSCITAVRTSQPLIERQDAPLWLSQVMESFRQSDTYRLGEKCWASWPTRAMSRQVVQQQPTQKCTVDLFKLPLFTICYAWIIYSWLRQT